MLLFRGTEAYDDESIPLTEKLTFDNLVKKGMKTKEYDFGDDLQNLQDACWGYKFIEDPTKIISSGHSGTCELYPALEKIEGLTTEKLSHSLKNNGDRDHNALFEDQKNYAYYYSNERDVYEDKKGSYITEMNKSYTDHYHKGSAAYQLFTPPIVTHNTMSFIFSEEEEMKDFPFTLVKQAEKIKGEGDEPDGFIVDLVDAYVADITFVGLTPKPAKGKDDRVDIYKNISKTTEFQEYNAGYPGVDTVGEGKNKKNRRGTGVSKFLFYGFSEDSDAVQRLLREEELKIGGDGDDADEGTGVMTPLDSASTEKRLAPINEFNGSNDLTSTKILVNRALNAGDTIYISGRIVRNRHFRQIVQLHTRISNDRLRMYKFYDWDSLDSNDEGFDLYNCLKPKSIAEAFNFVIGCHEMEDSGEKTVDENGEVIEEKEYEEQWRMSELLTNAKLIHRRWLKQYDGDKPLLQKQIAASGSGSDHVPSQEAKSEPLCWAADKRGIIKLTLKWDGTFTSEIIFARNKMGENAKTWFTTYLESQGLTKTAKLEDKLNVAVKESIPTELQEKEKDHFSEVFTSGMLFDVSQQVNMRKKDHFKLPYIRSFALAIGLLKSGDAPIGISNLDIIDELKKEKE
ncbi:MAG: hypothetical protein HOG49_28285, partial [Candidatus Scalindua sp.]|nr:hypothetical protein [Candidatus Scalindua sp.]